MAKTPLPARVVACSVLCCFSLMGASAKPTAPMDASDVIKWVLRYSKATGHNLVAYYAAFDINCSESTKAELKSLPVWMPERFLQKYQ
jgi:hypothetical protein